VAFLVAALIVGHWSQRLAALLAGAAGMWMVGTLDDRVGLSPLWRVLAEAAAASGLYVAGCGWHTSGVSALNLILTIIWVVGLVNAFNLMDNIDGACAAVAGVSAAGIGMVAALDGRAAAAGLSFVLLGACIAFLRWNLAGPARIFLGDGGSMPVGFLVAALALLVSRHSPDGRAGIVLAAMLAGLPILDVSLVCLSRTRRGVTLLSGGRDHLTHRLLPALGSPRRVALALAGAQGALCAAAVVSHTIGQLAVGICGLVCFLLGVAAILVLDTPRWRPAGITAAAGDGAQQPGAPPAIEADLR